MKQIFDFMRRRVTENTNTGRWGVGVFMDTINEAEAKWESEVCEWKHKEYHSCCLSECNGVYEDYDSVLGWEFCPYCGKPIKISEVE